MEPVTITFEDSSNKPITEEQTSGEIRYYRVFRSNNELIKRELFSNGTVSIIYRYLLPHEKSKSILAETQSEYPGRETVIVSRESYLDYILETEHWYNANKKYEGGIKSVLNHLNEWIYREDLDQKGHSEELRKAFNDGIDSYEFDYTETGELEQLQGWSESQEYLNREEIDLYLPGFLAENPYYADSSMLPEKTSKERYVILEKPAETTLLYKRSSKVESSTIRKLGPWILDNAWILILGLAALYFLSYWIMQEVANS